MSLALYYPGGGYYMRVEMSTGRGGDFSTSSDVSPAFGRRIAVQLAEVHEKLGGGPWRLVELGPGRGLLMLDLIEGLARRAPHALAQLEELVLVEISPSLRALQRERLAAVPLPVRWVDNLAELRDAPLPGVVVGNEFLDALPVHWVVRQETGELHERHVGLDGVGTLVFDDTRPAAPELTRVVDRYGICPRANESAELCVALPGLMEELAQALPAGAVLFVDYGLPAELLGDEAHAEGTLVAYRRHEVVFDLLANPGLQDITAHVNWTQLEDAAAAAGFAKAGRCFQDRCLMALGIAEDLVGPAGGGAETPQEARERLAARALIMPGVGGGKRFEVTAFTRGIEGALKAFAQSW